MIIDRHDKTVKLWLTAEDTRRWANRPGNVWPCSYLAGKTLFVEFCDGDLVDCIIDGEYDEALNFNSDEFNAITSDFINGKCYNDYI